MTITMIKNIIVSSGFNIFNTFINLYDQGFILNPWRSYIISKIKNNILPNISQLMLDVINCHENA